MVIHENIPNSSNLFISLQFFLSFFLIKNQITVKYNKSTTTDDKGVILMIYFVHYYKMVKISGHSISFSLLVSKTNTG